MAKRNSTQKRQTAEEAQRESEERFRTLYTKTPAVLHSIDADGILVAVSDRWLEVFGYERNEVIGRKSIKFLTAESRQYAETVSLPEFWKTGKARDVAYEFVKKDGKIFDVLLSAVLERDPEGDAVRTLAVLDDITERKRAEEALRESEERYRALYRKTPAMLHSIDAGARLIDVSEHWLEVLGYERNEVIGRSEVEFMTEESRRNAETVVIPEFMKAGQARDFACQFVKKNGDIVDIELSAVAEYDRDGQFRRSLCILTDVTQRKRAEQALRQAREALEGRVERKLLQKNPYGLTFREFTVLHHVATGRADKEIAHALGISPLTVHKHVANILGKMNAASRTEAAARALREGMLD